MTSEEKQVLSFKVRVIIVAVFVLGMLSIINYLAFVGASAQWDNEIREKIELAKDFSTGEDSETPDGFQVKIENGIITEIKLKFTYEKDIFTDYKLQRVIDIFEEKVPNSKMATINDLPESKEIILWWSV